jgi:hypothetical protein
LPGPAQRAGLRVCREGHHPEEHPEHSGLTQPCSGGRPVLAASLARAGVLCSRYGPVGTLASAPWLG